MAAPGADEADAAARARIESTRAQAETRFSSEERACYQTFAVNACLDKAKRARRQTLGDLRREENQLNDARRKREAAARLEDIAQRSSPETLERAQEKRDKAQEAFGRRAQRLQALEATRPASAAVVAPREARQARPASKPASAADNTGTSAPENKFDEAQRRKDRRDKKRADKTKPPAAPLPAPR